MVEWLREQGLTKTCSTIPMNSCEEQRCKLTCTQEAVMCANHDTAMHESHIMTRSKAPALLSARVFSRLSQYCYSAPAGSPAIAAESSSQQLILCLKDLTRHELSLREVADLVAASGHLAAMQWLRSQQTQLPCAATTCTAAAHSGSIPMLQFLTSQQPPCPWDAGMYVEACRCGHVAFLEHLRSEGYGWTQDCYMRCLRAAHDAGQEKVLDWLASQKPPGTWTPACCLRACPSGMLALLPWMAASPPFKWTRHHCHAAALMTPHAVLAHLSKGGLAKPWKDWCIGDLIERAAHGSYNIYSLAVDLLGTGELPMAAARHGQLSMLKWLLSHKRQMKHALRVLQATLESDQPQVFRFLMLETSLKITPHDLTSAGPRCLFLWAKAGGRIQEGNPQQMQALLESWYTFKCLMEWAATRQWIWPGMKETSQAPSGRIIYTPQGLLKRLAFLPDEVLEKIAAGAFVSPDDAEALVQGPPAPEEEVDLRG